MHSSARLPYPEVTVSLEESTSVGAVTVHAPSILAVVAQHMHKDRISKGGVKLEVIIRRTAVGDNDVTAAIVVVALAGRAWPANGGVGASAILVIFVVANAIC